jgi:N-acetylmuramoyl-L-alanine amidase
MLQIDQQGMVRDPKVIARRFAAIERTPMKTVVGIIVHQTDSASEQATFSSYVQGGNGARFLIAKDGTIYQTASVQKRTSHVGPLRARCLAEHKCKPAAFNISKFFPQPKLVERMNKIEMSQVRAGALPEQR